MCWAGALPNSDNADWDCGSYTTADVWAKCVALPPSDIPPIIRVFFEGNFQLFKHEVAICVFYELVGFSVVRAALEADYEPVKETKTTVARVDAYAAFGITRLQADETEKVGGYLLCQYNGTFSFVVCIALAGLVHQIEAFVEQRSGKKVTVSSQSTDWCEVHSSETFERKALLDVSIPSLRLPPIAVSCHCFFRICSLFKADNLRLRHLEAWNW